MQSVAGVIFSKDRSQIVLILRRDVPVWVLPGGGIDPGETAEQAILREILEETGFQVKIDSLIGTYLPANRLTKKTQLFRCTIDSGTPRMNEETRDIRFFSLQELPLMPPPYPEWIEDSILNGPPIERRLVSVNYRTLLLYFFRYPSLVIRFLLSRVGLHWNH